jgi:beta-xylosidase
MAQANRRCVSAKPNVGKTFPIETPQDSDEFDGSAIGPQWQWQANPSGVWVVTLPDHGVLRMFTVELPGNYKNMWDVPNFLLQKFPA